MNRRKLGKTLLLLATLLCLVWVVPAAALDTNVRIVRLSYASGDVQLDRRQGQGYERAIMNMPIIQGSRLWARGEDALAEVEFEDGSAMRLTPGTAVDFPELSLRESGEKVSSVDIESGTAYFDIRNRMGDFRVTFGGQQITVAHPARFRVFGDNGQFKVAVYKGDLGVRSGDNRIEVRSGETFALDVSDPGGYNLSKSIAEGSYDGWNQERERYTQSYTSASTYSADSYYNGFSPAYSYGLADLAYYGNYFNAPGWGWVWRPYYTGAAWNPFMDGSWMWYPQFGYMWVSPYPWGWMPYRYGAWNFVPGYGWCWMPGTTWNTWAPVTAVNRPPLNWVPVRPPAGPPRPGTPGIVAVGRTVGPVYPPGATHTAIPGTSLLPLNKGVITNSTIASPTAAVATPAAAANPAAKPAPPPARVHRDSDTARPRPAPSSRPSAPAAAPRSQASPSSGGSHSWGGEHAGASSAGGYAGGGSHGGGHR
ncbi:MAG TPA: FecR family protein [Terriglobales bacterium]|nr:FecR family protein [Terriglobales bacterium]